MSRVGKWPSFREELPSGHQQWRTLEAGGSALTVGHGACLPSVLDMRTKSGISLEFNILKETSRWTRELSVLISQQVLSPKRVKKKKNLKKREGEKREQGQRETDSSYCFFRSLSHVMFYAGELQAGLMRA